MNYLKNRYPFKFLTNIFRLATRTSATLPNTVEVKKNKSDTSLSKRSSQNLKRNSSVSVTESKNLEKISSAHKLAPADSYNSLPLSKTSSEHSLRGLLDRKKPSLDLNSEESGSSRRGRRDLDNELKLKLKELRDSMNTPRETISQENRLGLKRAYPWQNFNLTSISVSKLESPPKKSARNARSTYNLTRIPSDTSMASISNSTSDMSLKSVSSVSLDGKTSQEGMREIGNQMPLIKSILKKSGGTSKPVKEVTFNNISTIYRPGTSYSEPKQSFNGNQRSKSNSIMKNLTPPVACQVKRDSRESIKILKKEIPSLDSRPYMGRYERLKEKHSFVNLFTSKKQKTTL